MSIIDGVIINIVFLFFPLTLYTIYISYINTFHKEEKNIYLDFTIFTSLFLIIRYGSTKYTLSILLFINIPLLIAYLKDRKKVAILISLVLIYYNKIFLNISIYYTLIEYTLYFYIYIIVKRKKVHTNTFMNIFISIKSFILSFELLFMISPNKNIAISCLSLISLLIIFIYSTNIILSLIKKGDSMIELSNVIKELDKQKSLKLSLFKITHEIKNPIAVCKGYLEMIDYKDREKLEKYIPIIKSEIERTLTIINDFSDYGKLKIEKDMVDLTFLLEEIEETMSPLLRRNKIDFNFNMPDELYINLDYNRMKQVLINILKNAIEAKKETEKMNLTLDVKPTKKFIKIIVKDTGIGMSKETLARISDIFYTTKEHGTGLGVALSKEIIELHNGTINYKSSLGKGTTVTIKLPIK